MRKLVSSLLLLLVLTGQGLGYPGGTPDMACQSMLPTGHGAAPQASDPPFTIHVSQQSYKPGETLQVIVQPTGEEYYRGIFLQARMTGCDVNETRLIGVFTNTDSELETKHCFGDVHSAVSHKSARKKRLKTFYWTAPVVSSGHVVMRATVVRELQEYWTLVDSDVVVDLHATVAAKCLPPSPTPPPATGSTPPPPASDSPGSVVTVRSSQGKDRQTEATPQDRPRTDNTQETKTEVNIPPWLVPTFNRHHPPPPGEREGGREGEGEREGEPSWLIPAYQKGASSSSSSSSPASFFFCSSSAVRSWILSGATVASALVWMLFGFW